MSKMLLRSFSFGAVVLAHAFIGTPTFAAEIYPGIEIRSATVTNQYSYAFVGSPPAPTTGGRAATFFESDKRPGPSSQLGVQYTGEATTDTFYFLHNDYCVGQCQIASSTTIRFEVFVADQGDLEGLRFDSLITPGHLALVGLGSYEYTQASFAFRVNRTDVLADGSLGRTNTLYAADGYAGIGGLTVSDDLSGDNPFSNTVSGNNNGAGLYYDWSATPLGVELGGVVTGRTFYVDYTAEYSVKSFNTCEDIANCNAAQVVFGDPRLRGGGTDIAPQSLARSLFASDPEIDGGVHAVISRDYDAFAVPFDFVASGGDRRIATPAAEAPITYVDNYVPNQVDVRITSAVPEPATWASLVLGFGVIGAALRRRGHRRSATA